MKRELSNNAKEKIKELASKEAEHGKEACGLVVDDGDDFLNIYECFNSAIDNKNNYVISINDFIAAENIGEVVGVYHSHPNGENKGFSQGDMINSNKLDLINFLYEVETDKFYTFYPEE